MKFSSVQSAGLERQGEATGDMEKMHGKRNERCWHDVGGSKQEAQDRDVWRMFVCGLYPDRGERQ